MAGFGFEITPEAVQAFLMGMGLALALTGFGAACYSITQPSGPAAKPAAPDDPWEDA